MKDYRSQQGLIKLIVLIIVAILVLSYFKINLRQLVNSDTTQSNFEYVWSWVAKSWDYALSLWRDYISGPFFQALDRYR